MERRQGILQIRFHTNGGPLQWGAGPHDEFPRAFYDIGGDTENRVIIMAGTGEAFFVLPGTPAAAPSPQCQGRLSLKGGPA